MQRSRTRAICWQPRKRCLWLKVEERRALAAQATSLHESGRSSAVLCPCRTSLRMRGSSWRRETTECCNRSACRTRLRIISNSLFLTIERWGSSSSATSKVTYTSVGKASTHIKPSKNQWNYTKNTFKTKESCLGAEKIGEWRGKRYTNKTNYLFKYHFKFLS